MLKAEKLSDYFISMYKKLVSENVSMTKNKNVIKNTKGGVFEKIKNIFDEDENFNKTQVAKELGISRQQVYNYLKELKK